MRRLLLPLLLFAVLCWWFGLEPAGRALANASPRGIALYLMLTALVVLAYALRWRVVAHALGARLTLARLVPARLAGDAVGALVPSGRLAGEPVRVALVRSGCSSTAQSTAGVALDRLLEVIGNTLAVLGYVAVFCVARGAAGAGRTPFILAATMAAGLLALGALLFRLRRGHRPFAALYGERARALMPRLAGAMDGVRRVEEHLIHFFRQHPRAFLLGLLSSVLIELLCVAQYHALLTAFGIALDLPALLLVLLGGGLANAVPVPARLGVLEAAQVAMVSAAGGEPALGFVVAVIVRLHETFLLALGVAALAYEGVSLAALRLAAPRVEA